MYSPGACTGGLPGKGKVEDANDGVSGGGIADFAVTESPDWSTKGIPGGCRLLVATSNQEVAMPIIFRFTIVLNW